MAKTAHFKSVDEYILAQPEAVRSVLESVRSIIRQAVPKAQEMISYNIPAYKLSGGPVLFFAGWKQHYSVYPASEAIVTALKDELASFKISKGTIRFPLSDPVPEKLIARIARLRAKEITERAKAKPKAAKKG
jgi:uncharacterized protein YdhG (YjbR/CyaY superfamily)